MKARASFQVRPGWQDDWQPAMDLAWKTFLRFEAADYLPEGIRNFNDFITDQSLFRMFADGKYPLFVACLEDRVIGMITLRNESHISLLFVDEAYQRQGVGSALLQYIFAYLKEESGCRRVTVFAAPFGIGFYHRMGFADLGPQMAKQGIIYTPMECVF
mgnify:FL=1